MERATVQVRGVVQSVGFRPFVYRTAVDLDLRGTVRNRGDAGVLIEVEGDPTAIEALLTRLREDPPPLAEVADVTVDRQPVDAPGFDDFAIVESEGGGDGGGTIPPDTAMCEACLADLRDPDSRYHDYWATACVDCGPRFTVVEDLPYDRETTSMAAFPLCGDCRGEYEAPADRRYHAQAIACPRCGPALRYLAGTASAGDTEDAVPTAGRDPFPAHPDTVAGRQAVATAAATLADGGIAVVKGVGGAHLVCDATDADAVATLRQRTGRSAKPFAVMAPDPSAVEAIAHLGDAEGEMLTTPRRPIVLLDRRDDGPLAPDVAPGLHTVGVMLPYSGVHHLLFDEVEGPLVMTSANLPGQPMLVVNDPIVAGMGDVADGFLLHDRRIVSRCDDSVARVVDGRQRLVRRSRGFGPVPVDAPGTDGNVLALGPELDVVAGVLDGDDCFLTQYVGDVDGVATLAYLREAVDHLLSITGVDHPPTVAHDRHPAFMTTDLAERLEAAGRVDRRVPVQHHHAHAASVLGEHGRDGAVAITVDGVGYGTDGTVWGGEVLDATRADFDRVGGLAPMSMPGGDRATRYPGRMLAGALAHERSVDGSLSVLDAHDVGLPGGEEERDILGQQLRRGVNVATTTSAGRFLDAVAALVGACEERTYEGEPAMKLEAVATGGTARDVGTPVRAVDGRRCLDAPLVLDRLVDLGEEAPPADVAATAQATLGRGLAELAVETARERGREAVALTGGVAYNDHVGRVVRDTVEDAGLRFLGNEAVPPGDGGIAYGQAVVAASREETGR